MCFFFIYLFPQKEADGTLKQDNRGDFSEGLSTKKATGLRETRLSEDLGAGNSRELPLGLIREGEHAFIEIQ